MRRPKNAPKIPCMALKEKNSYNLKKERKGAHQKLNTPTELVNSMTVVKKCSRHPLNIS